jgi:hypothetical protein
LIKTFAGREGKSFLTAFKEPRTRRKFGKKAYDEVDGNNGQVDLLLNGHCIKFPSAVWGLRYQGPGGFRRWTLVSPQTVENVYTYGESFPQGKLARPVQK